MRTIDSFAREATNGKLLHFDRFGDRNRRGLIQDILESLDKNKAEVVLEVNIYEVSNTASKQIARPSRRSPSAGPRFVTA